MIRTHPTAVLAFQEMVGPSDPIAVEGGRTRWQLGGPLTEGVRCVRAPAGIVDHAPEDMTVRVLCGTSVTDLHDALRLAGQRTALPERGGTVGGALAVGDDDLSAPGLGTARAALLQCTTVSAEGRLVVGGGPTVKNVSGYDLPRLMVGALGTLGPLVEVLLRTVPSTPASGWWSSADADTSGLRADLYRPAALCSDGTTTWVHLRGHAADVAAQQQVLTRHGTFAEVVSGPALPQWRWSVPRSEVRRWVADRIGDGVACLMTGRLWRTIPQPPGTVDPTLLRLHHRLREQFDPTGRFNPGRDVLRS
jgi:glycolate oxidase FAD binding subunit